MPQVSEILEKIHYKSQAGEKLSDEEMLLLLAESVLFPPYERKIVGYERRSIKNEINKILLITLHMIGNVVWTTPVVSALREKYPDAHIAFMVGDVAPEVVDDNPHLDEIIVFEERRYWFDLQRGRSFKDIVAELREFALDLRRKGFDLIINLQPDPKISYLTYLADPKSIDGLITREDGQLMIVGNLWMLYWQLNYRKGDNYLNILDAIEINLKMVRVNPKTRQLNIFVNKEAKKRAIQVLDSFDIREKDMLVGLNPGVGPGFHRRAWRREGYAMLGDLLIKLYGVKVIIFGGLDDVALACEIEEKMKESPINLAGKTTLKELAYLISKCDHFITGDTGPMHVAGAMGTKIIALCGPNLKTPYGAKDHLILYAKLSCIGCGGNSRCKTVDCMKAITAEDVLVAVKFQRKEIDKLQCLSALSHLNIYTSGDKPPTRLFSYYPLEPKEVLAKEVADEVLKYAHLDLCIKENNKIDDYEEGLTKKEVWNNLNKKYKIKDSNSLCQEVENRDISKYLESLDLLYPREELPRAKEESSRRMKRFLAKICR